MISDDVVLKFTASWCGPCQRIKSDVHEACLKHGVRLAEIDVDVSELAATYRVTAMPTIVFVQAGVEVDSLRVVGANIEQICQNVEKFASMCRAPENQIILPHLEGAAVTCLPSLQPKSTK